MKATITIDIDMEFEDRSVYDEWTEKLRNDLDAWSRDFERSHTKNETIER